MEENFDHLKNAYASKLTYEILYARKCWNIRARFRDLGFLEDGGESRIYIKDIPIVINKILKYFLVEENWLKDGDSIWGWYTMLPQIANAINSLKIFLECLQYEDEEYTDDDFYIIFYDSY